MKIMLHESQKEFFDFHGMKEGDDYEIIKDLPIGKGLVEQMREQDDINNHLADAIAYGTSVGNVWYDEADQRFKFSRIHHKDFWTHEHDLDDAMDRFIEGKFPVSKPVISGIDFAKVGE